MATGGGSGAVFEVWTTGGGYYIEDIFQFLAAVTSGDQWESMLYFGLMFGMAFMCVKVFFAGNMSGMMQWIMMLAIVGGLGVGPRARVVIMDTTYPLEIYGTVSKVPLSVAFVAHFTTTASHALTERMETLLSAPDDLTYQRHGMLFGATLMSQAARWRAVTPTIANQLSTFMENCMIDGSNIGLVDPNELARTGNLSSFISNNVPLALAYFDEGSNTTVSCSDGWAGLSTSLGQEVNNVLRAKAEARAPLGGNKAGAVDIGALTGTIEEFQGMMGMAGAGATEYLRQSMLVMALDDGASRLIANSGNSAAMSLYQAARMEAQTRSSYSATGTAALKWVPMLKIAFEALYYGAFPLAMLLMMTPMAIQVARGYFGGFLWIASWEPLSAILHTIMLKSATGSYREHTTMFSGTTAQDVLNWANHLGVQSVEQDIGMVAGYMMMSIPFISTVIFFGAGKMGGLATSMLAVGQGAAIETGRDVATGNVGSGNVSMDNMRANKWDTSSMRDAGRNTEFLQDGTSTTVNQDGSRTYQGGSAQSNVGMSGTLGQSIRQEVSERASESTRAVEAQTEDLATSISTAASQFSDFNKNSGTNSTVGGGYNQSWSTEERKSYNEAWSDVERFAQSHNLSTDVALQAMIAGQGGVKGNALVGEVSASLSANGQLSGSSREGFERAVQAAQSQDFSNTFATLANASERNFSDHSASEGASASNGLRNSLDEVQSSSARLQNTFEQAQAYEKAQSKLASNDAGFSSRITDVFLDKMERDGYTPDQIAAIANPKTSAALNQQRALADTYLPEIMQEMSMFQNGGFTAPMAQNGGLYQAGGQVQRVDAAAAENSVPQPDVGGNVHKRGMAVGDENLDMTMNATDEVYKGEGVMRDAQQHSQVVGAAGSLTVGAAMVTRAGMVPEKNQIPDLPRQLPDPHVSGPVGTTHRQGNGGVSMQSLSTAPISFTDRDIDIAARTMLGEAGQEGELGLAAVAHVLKNRTEDPRWGNSPAAVALEHKQFSTWNKGAGGNSLASNADPNSPAYQRAAEIARDVFSGRVTDLTDGATHYWAPAGMKALVDQGAQSNLTPNWQAKEDAARPYGPVQLGGHIFTGKKQG